ncbi:MAG: His-Xaa-Ser system radical SAM maturase HxsC, partial [Planctomycetaceae bacterium]|nr:His-Xaa-Ser system radical SAM maturase HxsC [Planctomycetaceae bacterium]
LCEDAHSAHQAEFGCCLIKTFEPSQGVRLPRSVLPPQLGYLEAGDIVRISPRNGQVWVMYRRNSPSNSILLTERCNSWCVMCSQPPKKRDERGLIEDWLDAIPLMSPDTSEVGITGGEPTLLGDRFLDILRCLRDSLPTTAVHVLSNGRMFNYLSLASAVADARSQDLMVGIPLYSDIAWQHDFVVQTTGAFDQTIRGIMNLARCGVPVEIRVVLHRVTVGSLKRFAEFICRNLPFAQHIALMGLEPIGFGRTNFNALWMDPMDYQDPLSQAVEHLNDCGMTVSIYNHQLCTLPEHLWQFSRQSISDWKSIYVEECAHCDVQHRCGGFFHSATEGHRSRAVSPIQNHSSNS